MKQIAIFHCHTVTEATDRANLYYIASPTARRMEDEHEVKEIRIYAKTDRPLAVFRY